MMLIYSAMYLFRCLPVNPKYIRIPMFVYKIIYVHSNINNMCGLKIDKIFTNRSLLLGHAQCQTDSQEAWAIGPISVSSMFLNQSKVCPRYKAVFGVHSIETHITQGVL